LSDSILNLSVQFTLGYTRQAVIFLPGLCGSPLEMGSIPKLIHGQGHTVCFPRIDGYYAMTGLSNYQDWLDSLDRAVELLRVDHEEISIVGLSMGATLALTYASRYPNKCRSVVALAPVFAYDGWNVPWYSPLLFLMINLGMRSWSLKESDPFGLKNTEIRRRVEKQVRMQEVTEVGSSALSAEHLYQGLKLISYAKKGMEDLLIDTLIISAIDDDVVSPHSAEWVYSTIKSSVKKLIWLGNSYHIITLDNEREIVTNETAEFIQLAFDAKKSYINYSDEARTLVIKDRLTSEL
jgi:carboxylesterase